MRGGTAAAIVLAGGSGSRVGAGLNKVYLPLRSRPVIAWSLQAFVAAPGIGPVVLVVRAADLHLVGGVLAGELEQAGVEVVVGGATRQASELAGLRHLAPRIRGGAIDVVLIHDGARPLVGPALVDDVLRTARECGGAVPGLPCDDLVEIGGDGSRVAGPVQAGLVAMQTPQGFRAGPLLEVYEEADRHGFAGTDTASCVQRFAPAVRIRAIPGEERNFKITYAHDVAVAENVLAGRPAG